MVGGAGRTSSQRPQRDSRAPRQFIEEVGAPLSQSSGQAGRVPPKGDGDHVFKVGCMLVNQNMLKVHLQLFVSKVTAVEGGRVKWAWMDETGSASRSQVGGGSPGHAGGVEDYVQQLWSRAGGRALCYGEGRGGRRLWSCRVIVKCPSWQALQFCWVWQCLHRGSVEESQKMAVKGLQG